MMNKKGLIIILGSKSSLIPFSKALQKRGMRAGECERAEKEKVNGRKKKTTKRENPMKICIIE